MNKRITNIIMGLLLVVFMGILVGCPTETPKDKDKSGSGDGGPLPDIAISNEYIDFHSYYADITNNTGKSVKNVVFVVSTAEKPKLLTSIDDTAKLVRNFDSDTLKTRSITITWDDTFERKDLFVGGDIKENRTTIRTGAITITKDDDDTDNKDDYTENNVNWILKENTQYYLHAYYGDKNITKAFRTKTYPTNTTDADAMFAGDNTGNIFNVNALPNMEFRDPNPVGITSASYNHSDTHYIKIDNSSWGVCTTTATCASSSGLLIKFQNNAVSFGVASTGEFNILDAIVIWDKTFTTANTYSSIKNYGGLPASPIQTLTKVTR